MLYNIQHTPYIAFLTNDFPRHVVYEVISKYLKIINILRKAYMAIIINIMIIPSVIIIMIIISIISINIMTNEKKYIS